jgi:hypothetical protein
LRKEWKGKEKKERIERENRESEGMKVKVVNERRRIEEKSWNVQQKCKANKPWASIAPVRCAHPSL